MNKKLIAAALALGLLAGGSVSADWITAGSTELDLPWGNSYFDMTLTSAQRVTVATDALAPGEVNITFRGPKDGSELALSKVPVKTVTDTLSDGTKYDHAAISIIPFINTGNGYRYYIVDTKTFEGCKIVSYSNGTFTTAFEASSIPGTWSGASIEVDKKDLILHLKGNGDTKDTDYKLALDKKTGQFYAVPMSIEV